MRTLKVAAGDGFLVPDRTRGGCVFGRVITSTSLSGYLVELYARRYNDASEIDPQAPGETLFEPFLQSFKFSQVPTWTRLLAATVSDPHELQRRGIDLMPPIEVWFPERTERRVAGDLPAH